ncbi:MAG: hypothetical protein U0Z44_10825 [Kouleothrix sp.]|jgi:hypothetical protein|nr:hypothetical protein [Kouleothrix sp.]
MATLTDTYSPTANTTKPRARTGGPRRPQPEQPRATHDWVERYSAIASGSHMPLDTDIHWNWYNPLNIIPAFILLLFALTIIGLLVG